MPAKTLEDDYDPISDALKPPPDESDEERSVRLARERVEREVSDSIDQEIDREKLAMRKGPKATKILLLGQSESGKSTTLKNMQIMYEPKAFRMEKASWRAVIQLNLVRDIHILLDALSVEQETERQVDPELLKLRIRLSPLQQVEESLMRRLTPASAADYSRSNLSWSERSNPTRRLKEIAVNSLQPWRDSFTKLTKSDSESFSSRDAIDWDNPEDPGKVLNACCDDMIQLWNHSYIRTLLDKQNLRLEEMGGFFLDQLREVTAPQYVPTDDHILRARLKTLGVTEHHFQLEGGHYWRVFDVGGHRGLRAAWVPYFDDVDWILFLCPISAFDQVLDEAPKVNRLEDSVNLWKEIVQNPLLKNANIILFLNKIDIMKSKLDSGIRFADYVISYGARANDFESTSTYLKKKFSGIMHEHSPRPRSFYSYLTTVTDTKSTHLILQTIQNDVMRQNLQRSQLLV